MDDTMRDMNCAFCRRFTITIAIMAALNLTRLWLTWRSGLADGYAQLGFPFAFFERGGLSYTENWYVHFLFADLAIAVVVAYLAAHILRDGWRVAFDRLRTWGVDDIA